MRVRTILSIVALVGSATARPSDFFDDEEPAPPEVTEPPLVVEKRADITAPWVEVDDMGQPIRTATPSLTTGEDGSTEVVDAAPHDITASVFTQTYYGEVSTSTGEAPIPSATNKNGQGAFARCFNQDGDNAPLCQPAPSSTMFEGTTYYVTWDPDFFNKTEVPNNTTRQVSIRLDYLNRTSDKEAPNYDNPDDFEDHGMVKLDQTKPVPAEWGMHLLKIEGKYLKGPRPHNITLTLLVGTDQSDKVDKASDAIPLVLDTHRPPTNKDHTIENRDLIIALPVVFGSLIFLALGICLWNRKTRRIDLGNIMSRSRHGYTGRKVRRMFRGGDKDDLGAGSIRLDDRLPPTAPLNGYEDRMHVSPLYEYRDQTDPAPPPARRDSDLGSLAGTPVTPGFRDEDTGNTFRDELRRQEGERRMDRF